MRRAVGFLVLAFAAGALVAGCGGGGNKSASGSTAATTNATTGSSTAQVSTGTVTTTAGGAVTTHGRFHYPPILVRNYMKSCVGSARQSAQKSGSGTANFQAYCACTLDKLSNNVSTRDFAEIGLSNGHIPPRIKRFMSNAVADCADKL